MSLPYKILAGVVALVLAALLGGVVGYRLCGYSQAKAAVKQADADVTAITSSVDAQIGKQQATLQQQQDKSAALAAQQQAIRDSAGNLHLEIEYAVYTPSPLAGSCADPVDSDDFVRLYGSAAGNPTPAAPAAAPAR